MTSMTSNLKRVNRRAFSLDKIKDIDSCDSRRWNKPPTAFPPRDRQVLDPFQSQL